MRTLQFNLMELLNLLSLSYYKLNMLAFLEHLWNYKPSILTIGKKKTQGLIHKYCNQFIFICTSFKPKISSSFLKLMNQIYNCDYFLIYHMELFWNYMKNLPTSSIQTCFQIFKNLHMFQDKYEYNHYEYLVRRIL